MWESFEKHTPEKIFLKEKEIKEQKNITQIQRSDALILAGAGGEAVAKRA